MRINTMPMNTSFCDNLNDNFKYNQHKIKLMLKPKQVIFLFIEELFPDSHHFPCTCLFFVATSEVGKFKQVNILILHIN